MGKQTETQQTKMLRIVETNEQKAKAYDAVLERVGYQTKEKITMATIKSYTDIEQSKKLAEILPLESADMHYSRDFCGSWFVDLDAYSSIKLPKYAVNNVEEWLLPCWSLAALLDLMPQHIYDELGCRTFGMVKSWDKRRYQVFYEHHTAYIQREAETAIDAVFEMIIWLKENKKI